MSRIISLAQSPEEILLGTINFENDASLKITDVDFEEPLELIDNPEYNTQITLSAKLNHEIYSGTKTVSYNRLDLHNLFGGNLAVVTGHVHDHITALELLNPEFGMELSPESVYIAEVNDQGIVEIKITTHLIYQPNSKVGVINEFDYNLGVLDKLINIDLAAASQPAT